MASPRSFPALGERLALLRTAFDIKDFRSGTHSALRWTSASVSYLLDLNKTTVAHAMRCTATGRQYIVDTGDDAYTLARNTEGRFAAVTHSLAELFVLRNAAAVVCRGVFHQPVIAGKTHAPLLWAPDTVADEVLDGYSLQEGDSELVASFGSAGAPRRGDRAYGWEIVDLLARRKNLRGLLVINGPGLAALRHRARRLGVEQRLELLPVMPLLRLVETVRKAAFITSVQSMDRAGWVRTTGKLPLTLGIGKVLLSTRAGEASLVLPERHLSTASDDEELVDDFGRVVDRGVDPYWKHEARSLAERYRRSTVAAELSRFVCDL